MVHETISIMNLSKEMKEYTYGFCITNEIY